jgi:RNA polymerase sigma factor (sigma-70 family)
MESLVERVKTADELACKELYEQFSKPMYNLCLRMMNHEQDALDVLQDSFVKIFQNIGQLEQASLLPAWIKRICVNTCLQTIEKKKKLRFEDIENTPVLINMNDEENIVNEEEFENNMNNIISSLSLLPEKYRIVFTMYAIEDYSHEEISQMLGIANATSRSQYLRAKQKLVEILKKNEIYERSIERIHTTA